MENELIRLAASAAVAIFGGAALVANLLLAAHMARDLFHLDSAAKPVFGVLVVALPAAAAWFYVTWLALAEWVPA